MISITNTINNQKLPISFFLIIFLFVLFGIVTINGLRTLGDFTKTIYEHPLVVSNASLHAALNIAKIHRSMKDVVLAGSSDEIKHTLAVVAENEHSVYQQLDTIQKDILGEEGKALEKKIRQLFKNWKPIRDRVVRLLYLGHKQEAILITRTNGAEHVAKLEVEMLELTSYARKKADSFIEFAEIKRLNLEKITFTFTISGVLAALFIAFIATKLVLDAEKALQEKNDCLQQAIDEIKTLQGILPICMHCKEIRDDKGSWNQLEKYISEHSEVRFSHGICEECFKKHYPDVANFKQ